MIVHMLFCTTSIDHAMVMTSIMIMIY